MYLEFTTNFSRGADPGFFGLVYPYLTVFSSPNTDSLVTKLFKPSLFPLKIDRNFINTFKYLIIYKTK